VPNGVLGAARRRVARFFRRLRRVRFSSFSLRSRLLCLAVALVAVGLTVSDALVLTTVQPKLVSRADSQLERFAKAVAHSQGRMLLGGGPGGWGMAPQYIAGVVQASGAGTTTVWYPDSATAGMPRPQLSAYTVAELHSHTVDPITVPSVGSTHSWRVLAVTGSDPSAVVVVAVSLDETNATVGNLVEGFWAIGGGVLLLIILIGWFAVRTGLRPLQQIETTATEIAAGHPLSHRMPEASHRTEVGRMSSSLNSMLEQIESAFAARAASEARMRSFVADASHELRTPLAGIRGFAELYRMGALSEEADIKRTMARIESEAVRMGGLVEDLLMLARLDEQRPIELAPMDLRTLAADALHDTTALDPTRPVSLTGPGGTTAPGAALVLGDEARLRQVVTNLVGNAVRHTPPGTPVRIGVGMVDGRGVIEVADQGPGLTPEQSARVFERFYRVDASRSRQEGGGAGLGLAIVSALVAAHRGDVQVESAPGRGAVFRVLIPTG